MNYTFRVDKLIPKSEFMSVTYMAEGYPDYRRNFNPTDFSEESLRGVVADFAPNVVDFWERQEGHPEEAAFAGGSGTAEAPVVEQIDPTHETQVEPQPEYDHFTQRIEQEPITHYMQETVGWKVIDMTAQEQAEYLDDWRMYTAVTMGQFRQALLGRGITEAESSISASDPVAQILWESSGHVLRKSERVKKALSMTDKELDEFFIHASTLEVTL